MEKVEWIVGCVDIENDEHIDIWKYYKEEFELALAIYDSIQTRVDTYKYLYSQTLEMYLLEEEM